MCGIFLVCLSYPDGMADEYQKTKKYFIFVFGSEWMPFKGRINLSTSCVERNIERSRQVATDEPTDEEKRIREEETKRISQRKNLSMNLFTIFICIYSFKLKVFMVVEMCLIRVDGIRITN